MGDPKVRLRDCRLEQANFEIRYPFAYALWDRAGEVWTRLARSRPKLRISDAQPVKVVAANGDSQMSVEMEKASIIVHNPERDLHAACVEYDDFYQSVVSVLSLQTLTRVGFRMIYVAPRDSAEAAASTLGSLRLMELPKKPAFSIGGGKVVAGSYSVTLKGESVGCVLTMKTDERVVQLTSAPGLSEVRDQLHRSHRLAIDFDYYTVAPAIPAQINPTRWVEQVVRAFARDISSFGIAE